ncbi:DUF1659 domain-containing protein [Bacillus sp. 31A1R]|uniref:DUF1659 domain-containing protein n=1 Tax=Robertmurraya mangrovi TaxID=3098077 RepID=A0ABU5J0W3_9BACI|nr:DUF1659 domain-containing protein [Bacillus sp. 31A1R]MDZ5473039.1 DUF1659 domain-containing protein [Bacillus sp. 31A1R]
MAQQMILSSKLRLVFDGGMDDNGKTIYKNKTYSNIRREATADQLLQAGQALANLSVNALVSVERTDNFEIVN